MKQISLLILIMIFSSLISQASNSSNTYKIKEAVNKQQIKNHQCELNELEAVKKTISKLSNIVTA